MSHVTNLKRQPPTKAATGPGQRIIIFDLLRGLLLLNILINHIELYPSGYDLLSGRGRMFVSAAEGFFFISGLLVGLTYRRKVDRGMLFVFRKMWTRSAQLYVLAVSTTLIYSYWALKSGHYYIKDDALVLGQHWGQIIKNTLEFKYSFGWADFLTHFAVYMFFAPFALWALIKKQWALVLLASFAVWWNRGLSFTAAWQIIFFGGMVIGYHWQKINSFWRNLGPAARSSVRNTVIYSAIVTFFISFASTYFLSVLNERFDSLPLKVQSYVLSWNQSNDYIWRFFQKWTMEPGRIILFFIWFSAIYMLVMRYQKGIDRRSFGFIKLIGQNSLFVYLLHSLIVFVFKLYWPKPINLLVNFLLTSLAIVTVVGLTKIYTKRQLILQKIKLSGYKRRSKLKNVFMLTDSNR